MRSPLRSLARAFTARAPVAFVGTGQQGRWGGRGDRGTQLAALDALEASAALYAIVNRTSTAVAKETWHMHRARPGAVCGYKDQRGACEAEDVEQVVKHPALTVINKPNGFYTAQELVESGQQHVDLTGEGWLIISRMGKLPYELWVARPDRMIVVTDRQEFLVGYLYIDPDGVEVPIRREDVLSIRMPNPKNPYRGLGPVQSILTTVEAGNYSSEWNTSFFRNGARPGGIVKLERSMQDAEFDQLVERFNANHRGTANANRTAFLEEGDWVDVRPMSIADMQFVETANLNRDTILLAYGMSKFAVGVVEDVNRATADASAVWFGETATIPRLDRWQGMWNNDFLPQFPGYDERLALVYSNPIPADREAARADKSAAVVNYVSLKGAGVEAEAAAEVAGLPPMAVAPPPPAPELPAAGGGLPAALSRYAAGFNPHQRRGRDGKWTDGGLPATISHQDFDLGDTHASMEALPSDKVRVSLDGVSADIPGSSGRAQLGDFALTRQDSGIVDIAGEGGQPALRFRFGSFVEDAQDEHGGGSAASVEVVGKGKTVDLSAGEVRALSRAYERSSAATRFDTESGAVDMFLDGKDFAIRAQVADADPVTLAFNARSWRRVDAAHQAVQVGYDDEGDYGPALADIRSLSVKTNVGEIIISRSGDGDDATISISSGSRDDWFVTHKLNGDPIYDAIERLEESASVLGFYER